jgi:hypothetical protein
VRKAVLGGEPIVIRSPTRGAAAPVTPLTRVGRVGTLPFTGFALMFVFAAALLLLGGGSAVRRVTA